MRVSILLALPSLAVAAPVWGQECDAECAAALEYERTQSGRGTERDADEPLEFSHVITVHGALYESDVNKTLGIFEIDKPSGVTPLETNMYQIPGFQQFRRSDSRSANPTSQGVTLRGLGGNASSRALLFLDGVPQADPFGGWVSWTSYDPIDFARIRAISGGGQVSAGPGALAGVVEIESSQYDPHRAITVGSDISGGAASGQLGALYNYDLGSGWVNAGISYADGKSFVPIIASQRGGADRAARSERASLVLRGVGFLAERVEMQASMRAFTDRRDRGIDFSANENSGVDASIRVVKRDGNWKWSITGYVQLRDFSSQFGSVSADRSTVMPTLDQFATPSTGLGARFELRPPVGANAELRLGGEWRSVDGETKERFTYVGGSPTRLRTAGGQTNSLGGFAELSIRPVEDLTISAGGRLDAWQISSGFRREINIGGSLRSDDRFADRSGTEWTGRIGISHELWTVADGLKLRGAAYRSWRLPTLNELYRPFRVGADATAANETLRPEVVKGVEAGLDLEMGFSLVTATLFYNRLDHAITNVTLGQGPGTFLGVGFVAAGGAFRQRQNVDAIVSKGLELAASFQLATDFELKLGYAMVDAKMRGSGLAASLDGLRPAQVAKHSGNARLIWTGDGYYTEAALRYTGKQFEDDANSRMLGDAVTADFIVGYQVAKPLELQLRVDNILNARVEAAISSTGIVERTSPRTWRLGVYWSFD